MMNKSSQLLSTTTGNSLYTRILHEGQFRLLEWQDSPDQSTRVLNFRLIQIALDRAPEYDALSYRWQDPDPQTYPDAKITCDGTEVLVGNNLYTALLRIAALPGRSTCIWVDCICIEQSDLVEKQRQILMMPQIYPKAQKVIIWLGESTERSDAAMDLLLSLIRLVISIDENLENGKPLNEFQTQALDILRVWNETPAHPSVEEMWRLYQREWFDRVWTLQEATLASSTSLVMCGNKTFLYGYITHFADRYVNDKIGHWVKLTTAIRPTSIGTDPENPERPTMLHTKAVLKMRKLVQLNAVSQPTDGLVIRLLDYVRVLQSTDDKDRILSLAAVLPSTLINSLRNKGPSSTESLYIKFASLELRTSRNMYCLSAAGLCQQRRSYPTKYNMSAGQAASKLPSWVPDWAYRKRHEPLWTFDADLFEARGHHLYQATRDSQSLVTYDEDGDVLHVRGMMLDTVLDCGDPYRVYRLAPGWDVNKNPEVLVDVLNNIREHIDRYVALTSLHFRTMLQDDVFCMESTMTAIRKTITGNMVPEVPTSSYAGTWIRARPDQTAQMFEDFEEDIRDAMETQERTKSPMSTEHDEQKVEQDDEEGRLSRLDRNKRPMLMLCMSTMCKGRRFFITEGGRMGMGPDILQKGDQLCVLFGACTPFVLRLVVPDAAEHSSEVNKPNCYELVGECYVDGLMDGEAMSMEDVEPQDILLV